MEQSTRLSLQVYGCVILRKDNRILLLQRSNTGYIDGHWAIPGGSLDPHETITEAAVREMHEELNIKIDPQDLTLMHVLHTYPPTGNTLGFFFLAERWQGEPKNLEPHKHADMQWFGLDALPETLAPAAQHVIGHVMLEREQPHYTIFKQP